MPTLADYVEQALEKIGKAATTYEIYGHVGKLSGWPMTTLQQAAIRTVLQRDNRFYRVSRGVWDLSKRSGTVTVTKNRVKRKVKEKIVTVVDADVSPATDEWAPAVMSKSKSLDRSKSGTPFGFVMQRGPSLEYVGGVRGVGPQSPVYLPEEVFASAPLPVLEEMWRSYIERKGDWANLSPLHAARLKAEIDKRKSSPALAVKAPEIVLQAPKGAILQPSVEKKIVPIASEPLVEEAVQSSPDPDLESVRQFNAPEAPINLPVPIVREGPSSGSGTQEPLGPGQVGKTYTTGPGAVEEVVDEVELRRKLERQKAKARRRFQSPGWNAPTSMIPEEGTRTWFSSEDRTAPPGKWREFPGWFKSENKPRGKWKSFPGWFASEPKPRGKWKAAPGWFSSEPKPAGKWKSFPGWFYSAGLAEPEYGREITQEARVAWLEDRIMSWKERLRKGEVSEAGFRHITTYLYDQLEHVDPYNRLVAERYAEPVKRKELSDNMKLGMALTASLGIIGALLWKKSNRQ